VPEVQRRMTFLVSLGLRLIGGHLVSAFLARSATGALYTFEHLAVGLGFRFCLGFGTACYFLSPPIRHAIDGVIVAVKDVVVG